MFRNVFWEAEKLIKKNSDFLASCLLPKSACVDEKNTKVLIRNMLGSVKIIVYLIERYREIAGIFPI